MTLDAPRGEPGQHNPLPGLTPAGSAASGNEATVLRSEHTSLLFKRYRDATSSPTEMGRLNWLTMLPLGFDSYDRGLAETAFSWPRNPVFYRGALIGVLVPEAPARFYFEFEGRRYLREGQHLPRGDTVAGHFDDGLRLTFLLDLCAAFALLDRHGLVHGDASSRNVLFSPSGKDSAFLLDCDGIQAEGQRVRARQRTPAWSEPTWSQNDGPRRSTDRYVLALWILRVIARSMLTPPPPPQTVLGHATQPRVLDLHRHGPPLSTHAGLRGLLARGLGDIGQRPSPAEWAQVLHDLRLYAWLSWALIR